MTNTTGLDYRHMDFDDIGFDITKPRVTEEIYSWFDTVQFLSIMHDDIFSFHYVPSFSYVENGFGVYYQKSLLVTGNPEDDSTDKAALKLHQRESLELGFSRQYSRMFSLGISGQYNRTAEKDLTVPEFTDYGTYCSELNDAFGTSDPDEIGLRLVNGRLFKDAQKKHTFRTSAGAMANMGGITLGASVNIPVSRDFISGFSETDSPVQYLAGRLNVGAAFESDRRKTTGRSGIINFLFAADIQRIGDDEKRSLHAGAELELNISRFFQASIRAGYQQNLAGSFQNLLHRNPEQWIDYDRGTVSIGAGARLFTAQLDAAVLLPARFAQKAMQAWVNGSSFGWPAEDTSGPKFMLSGSMVF
jgi:hypothetical protein